MTCVSETPISSAAGAARPMDSAVPATEATDWFSSAVLPVLLAGPTRLPGFQAVAAQG